MQEKEFIQKGARKVRLHEFLEDELEGAGYSHADIVRTPTSTKIVIHAQRPGLVIGRGGSRIKELTSDMEDEFDFENPQIEVDEIEEPDKDAEVVAKSMSDWLEKGGRAKRVGFTYLRRMKEAGVIGAEIEITGKLSGNRGRTEKFSYGYVKRCGNTSRANVDHGYSLARTQPGAIGVKVRIMKEMPEFLHRDVDVEEQLLHKTVEEQDAVEKTEQIEMIISEAESMTSAEIERSIEELEDIPEGEISKSEVRDVFESGDFETDSEESSDTKSSEEEKESDDNNSEDSAVAYEEIVSGTISDGKEQLKDLEDPDWEAALEAEKENKDRKTFKQWLENKKK